jgi:methyl-branched lipid omega-hydroxylase
MRRNLTEDIELNGVPMKAGDKVSMWYNSANRDERKFGNPWLFDVTRNPNPQIGFGAGGAHFCLGANLAQREIRVLFEELHRQTPDVVAVEQPAILRSAPPTRNGLAGRSIHRFVPSRRLGGNGFANNRHRSVC